MASAHGLKRPSDFDLEYPAQHTSANSASASSSCQWSVNKRRCTTFANQSMMASPTQLTNANQAFTASLHNQHGNNPNSHQYQHHPTSSASSTPPSVAQNQSSSPFKDPMLVLGPLCDDVTSLIKTEVQRAHPQHQPNLSSSSHQQQPNQHHHIAQPHNQQHPQHTHPLPQINFDAPTLSIRQTQAICEKIIRERELRLREEYDKILVNKLAEQYDTFVKYTQDHIERRYNEANSHQASYLS